MDRSRRDFIKKAAIGTAGITLGAHGLQASGMKSVLGANSRMNFGIAGVAGRGKALVRAVAESENTSIGYICDVDTRAAEEAANMAEELTGNKPEVIEDYRKMVEIKDLDAVAIASPDHWHTPMTLMAVQNGKHVYVEKPCSHNPHEGELLVKAQKKYNDLVIQMGNQQRSAITSIQAMQDIREGLIGEVYHGKSWYANARGPIGIGQKVSVPDWLNWELWQGPAPRREYRDNWVHYDWHWFWNWGTGEINNNGTHEIDICRWALGVKYPTMVNSAGGRYHYNDDWEFYDTQIANYQFEGGKMLTWEGRSCNPFQFHDRGRGATIHGTEGTILLDRNNYIAWDMDNNEIKHKKEGEASDTMDTTGMGSLDVKHMTNFLNAIREGEEQHSPIDEGVVSNDLCHLGNISQEIGRALQINPSTGRIMGDGQAMQMWGRSYEPGWEPTV
ncbi:MAG: Gfo/Idh/MocA family protein [Bacteroidota bacterium]